MRRQGLDLQGLLRDSAPLAGRILVSTPSVREIAIKHGLGRGDMPVSGADALAWFEQSGYSLLSISPQHTATAERLPSHHRDPFDRIPIAQAIDEPLRLLTHDSMIATYSDTVILV